MIIKPARPEALFLGKRHYTRLIARLGWLRTVTGNTDRLVPET